MPITRLEAFLQVKYWIEKGKSEFDVIRYEMRRRPGQGELCSKALVFGGGCAPKSFTVESRQKEVRVNGLNLPHNILLSSCKAAWSHCGKSAGVTSSYVRHSSKAVKGVIA